MKSGSKEDNGDERLSGNDIKLIRTDRGGAKSAWGLRTLGTNCSCHGGAAYADAFALSPMSHYRVPLPSAGHEVAGLDVPSISHQTSVGPRAIATGLEATPVPSLSARRDTLSSM